MKVSPAVAVTDVLFLRRTRRRKPGDFTECVPVRRKCLVWDPCAISEAERLLLLGQTMAKMEAA